MTLPGIYSVNNFKRTPIESPFAFEFYLNGIKAQIKTENLPPSPGEITVHSNGRIEFHESDAGKTLTGSYSFQAGFLSETPLDLYQVNNYGSPYTI